MSLHLHRAERAGRLVDALADLLAVPLADPFAPELVAVPTPGVERWLAQRLAGRLGASPGRADGVCATIEFPTVASVLQTAVATGTDPASLRADPWHPVRAVWPLLEVIDRARGEGFAELLWAYLTRGRGERASSAPTAVGGRRWATARRLAELFARYAAERPDLLRRWQAGEDCDAHGDPLPSDRVWQPELWRRLRARLAVAGPVERVDLAVARLKSDPGACPLPERLSLFGLTRVDATQARVLAALAEHRDVHLWLPHPSPALWDTLAARLGTTSPMLRPRSSDATADLPRHRLLAHLGRDSREVQLTLAAAAGAARDRWHGGSLTQSPTSLLELLQADLSANAAPLPLAARPTLAVGDRSLTVHVSHGPDRQVEVLRDLLVGLLADDPSLEPRDIVVMCPDVETFAPHLVAAFGLETSEEGADHPAHLLRVRLADRALRQVNPLLEVAVRLLTLVASRVERTAVLDLASLPAVARKFGFRDDDLARLQELVTASGIRWGLDRDDRGRYGMSGFGQNTWAAGLDRLLLGVALDEDGHHHLGTALPLDDVDSSDVDLIGRFAEFVARLRRFSVAAHQRQPLTGWIGLLRSALADLTAVSRAEAWQSGQAYGLLASIADQAGESGAELSLDEMTLLLTHSVRGRPSRANFRTGTITVCTMLPMRSVPHRVICLLGVDDGVFPRRPREDGDDLVAVEEWIGDRSGPSEDRQLLLDAVMAAEERLIVVYGGRDPRTGAVRPPAVPIGELLDAVDHTVRSPDAAPVRDHITTIHPLQPFDARNFCLPSRPEASGGPFSFDRAALRGARAAVGPRRDRWSAFDRRPLPEAGWDGSVELADLLRFFNHPARALLRERGRLFRWRDEADDPDEIPAELDGLARWSIGQRFLQAHLAGADLDRLAAAEWRRGQLPPREFGHAVLADVTARVGRLSTAAAPYRSGPPARHEVTTTLDEWSLSGTVSGVHGTDVVRVQYGRLTAKHRLEAWLELLALTLAAPDEGWRAVLVGSRSGSVLGPVNQQWSRLVLADLVSLWRIGRSEPLPFATRTSAHYAELQHSGQPWDNARDQRLQTTWEKERDEAYACFFGPKLSDLQQEAARPEEQRGSHQEPTRFGVLARRVFLPLLHSEGPL
jgi:exodeoxyribonuclease V gamma subunit